MKHRFLILSKLCLTLALISGCSWLADVSSTMRVNTGLEPENIDKNVRFRTTYYFRILTGCKIEPTPLDKRDRDSSFVKRISGEFVPLNDSLYRFRMTGQAAALFNRVHFESGVLRKEQIDPFGSTVRYHEETGSFLPVSADEIRADAKTHTAKQDIQEFRKLYRSIVGDKALTDEARTRLLGKLIEMIEDRLDILKQFRPLSSTAIPASTQSSSTDISARELKKLTDQFDGTTHNLRNAETSLKDAESKFKAAQDKVDTITKQLTEAKDGLNTGEDKSGEAQKKVDDLSKQLSTANKKLEDAKSEIAAAKQLVTELTNQVTATKTQIKAAQNELDTAKKNSVVSLQELSKKTEALLAELGVMKDAKPSQNEEACNGRPSTTKYFLLGPEGSKELDPNDRLLLALSVDSKPLISALQQLSDRKFQPTGGNLKTMEDLLEERGRVLDSRSILQKAEKDAGPESTPTDQSKLKTLLDELRKPYVTTVTTHATAPEK